MEKKNITEVYKENILIKEKIKDINFQKENGKKYIAQQINVAKEAMRIMYCDKRSGD